ncbi:MAG: class I SAM-dependent methyltransferase [Bryobacteraceae bacterium]
MDKPVSPLVARAWEFQQELLARKAELSVDFDWYPYDSMANAVHLDALCDGGLAGLLGMIEGELVADVGCADGDFALFLESLGCRVHAVDHPMANHNSMRGVRAMKEALGSQIEIHRADLDSCFELPAERYKLIFFFGTLYHLRNPFQTLERLAAKAEYCVVSTRIARRLPNGLDVGDAPVAYLLDADELNADNSNFWIFTEAGLRRLLRRSHWAVERFVSVGDRTESDPTSGRDERAFCLGRSTFGVTGVDLMAGWNPPEGSGWRWTERSFSIRCPLQGHVSSGRLRMTFYLAPEFLETWKTLTVRYSGTGEARTRGEVFDQPGSHTMTIDLLPLWDGQRSRSEVYFTLDHWLDPDAADKRERGIIVTEMRVEYA